MYLKNYSKKQVTGRPPFWFMRQAGRYLPEYRQVRASLPGFLDLCYHPEKAREVTLQPLARFDMDAAIIFSDILVIPHAMGLQLTYEQGEGPLLEVISAEKDLLSLSLDSLKSKLQPVYDAIALTREALPEEKTLIGFAGAPWTLACYMIEGRGKTGFPRARETIITDEAFFTRLFSLLEEAIVTHLSLQIQSGANVVQLFDSWAGLLPYDAQPAWITQSHARIASRLRHLHPDVPMIGFPKGIGDQYGAYVEGSGVDVIAVDMHSSMMDLAQRFPDKMFQGNLDPMLLAFDGAKAQKKTEMLLAEMQSHPFIFNLGHGMIPQTPPENVEAISRIIRNAA